MLIAIYNRSGTEVIDLISLDEYLNSVSNDSPTEFITNVTPL